MPPKKSTKRKAPARKRAPPKKIPARKAPPKKTAAKKTSAKRVPPKKVEKKTLPAKKVIPKKNVSPEEKPAPQPFKEETPKVPKKRGQRKKVTLESHYRKFDDLLELVNSEIKRKSREKEKGVRTLQRIRKTVRELKSETPRIANTKRKLRTPNSNRVSGFRIKYPVNAECAAFLQVKEGTPLNRTEVTNAICVYAHLSPDEKRPRMLRWEYLNPGCKRNLQRQGERMALDPDDVLIKLLRYDEYQRKVKDGEITKTTTTKGPNGTSTKKIEVQDDDTLYYRVLQKLIGHLFIKPDSK